MTSSISAAAQAGTITAGIAKAVGPNGSVTGIDRDEKLLELARTQHTAAPNLQLEQGDATTLQFHPQFDVVTAARTRRTLAMRTIIGTVP